MLLVLSYPSISQVPKFKKKLINVGSLIDDYLRGKSYCIHVYIVILFSTTAEPFLLHSNQWVRVIGNEPARVQCGEVGD